MEKSLKIMALADEINVSLESIIVELPSPLGVHSSPGTAGIRFFPVNNGDDL
jgi:hypothetical protein